MPFLEGTDVKILIQRKTDWARDCNTSMSIDEYFQSRDAFPTGHKETELEDGLSLVDYSIGIESGERLQVQTVANFKYFVREPEELDYAFQVRIKGKNAQKLIDELKSVFYDLSE